MDHKSRDDLEHALPWYTRSARERLLPDRTAGDQRVRSCHVPWKSCAAAAGASLTFGAIADAAVLYVEPMSPIRLEIPANVPGSDSYGLDLDGNGQPDLDFQLMITQSTNTATQVTRRRARARRPFPGNSVVGSSFTAKQLVSAAPISNDVNFIGTALIRGTNHFVYTTGSIDSIYGEWDANSTGLLGVKFRIAGGGAPTTHFGWIRVRTDMDDSQTALEILNWAYEDVPNMSISAGDEVGTIVLLGDYNKNREVDSGDYDRWKDEFGLERFPGEGADGNADGIVNAADYTIWRDNLGNTVESAVAAESSTIPEPATLSLGALALGAAGVMALRRRQRPRGQSSEQVIARFETDA